MIRTALLVFLSLLALQSAGPGRAGQAYGSACPSAAAPVVELLTAARALRTKGNNEAALHCFARAADDAAARGDAAQEAEARTAFAQAAYGLSKLDLAVLQANAANALFIKLDDRLGTARTTRLLASVAFVRGDRPEAARLYSAALETFTALGEQRERISALTDLARSESGDASVKHLEEALDLARQIGATDLEGVALHSRSDRHFGAGRFDAAIADLLKAIERLERTDAAQHLSEACVSLGRIMRAHGRHEEAIRYYNRAIGIQQRAGDLAGQVQSLNAKAVALSYLDRPAEERTTSERALELAKESGNPRLINFQQGNLASTYGSHGDYPRAIRLLEDVLTRETDPYLLAYRHGSLASFLRTVNDASGALPHIQQAIQLAKKGQNSDYLPVLMHWAALIYGDLGRTADALAAASEGIEMIERLRGRLVPLDFMKRGFGDRFQDLYGATIRILNQRGDHDQALSTSEQARSRAFLDLLASRELANRDPAPVSGGDLRHGGVASSAAVRTVSTTEIAATAARLSSAIVSYWVTKDDVFVWVTAPGAPTRSVRIPVARKELERLVRAAIPRPGQQTSPALGRLHALLIAPVRQWLPAGTPLTIIPHGPLFRVSFAALRDSAGIYLIERHPLTYSPSISILEFTAKRLASTNLVNGTTYLLVADPSPVPAATPALVALPAARRETSAIAQLVGARRSMMLNGPRAGEASVRASMLRARVVHFATHGVIRDDAPFESFLALGAGGAGSTGDGRLTVRELYDVELNAELVVLSACSTATGAPSGDGISGLSRALFYAGTSSVLATLWDVADEPSALLMAGFYRHWQGGMSKRSALRQAQIDLLRALRAGKVSVKAGLGTVPLDEQPYFWAGYILVGEP